MFEDSKVVDPAVLFPALAAAIDALTVRPDPATPAAVVTAEARALVVLTRRVQALLLGRLAVIDGQGLAEGDGFGSATAWVAGYTNQDRPGARALIKAARVADRLPSLGQLLGAGKIGPEHLSALASGAKRVPDEVLAEHEFTLTNLAPHARPSDMRRVGEKIRTVHDHDAAEADAGHLHESRHLSLVRTFQGGWDLQGALDPEAGASVQVVLDALATKKGPEDTRTAGQRRADALVEAVQLGMRSGMLPDVAGDRPRVTFLVRTDTTDSDSAGAGADAGGGAATLLTAALTAGYGGPGRSGAGRRAGRAGAPDVPPRRRRGHRPRRRRPAGRVQPEGRDTGRVQLPPRRWWPWWRWWRWWDSCATRRGDRTRRLGTGSGRGTGSPAVVAGDGVRWWSAPDLRLREELATETVERVCCNAIMNLTLVDRWGDPLHLGRNSRSHSPTQGRAVIVRDGHCVFPGCDVPTGAVPDPPPDLLVPRRQHRHREPGPGLLVPPPPHPRRPLDPAPGPSDPRGRQPR